MTDPSIPDGHVVRLVTDDELLFNRGSKHGVKKGMHFEVIDPQTEDVVDPLTGDNLGSIPRRKARIRIISVNDQMARAEIYPRRGREGILESTNVLMGPRPRSGSLTDRERWPDGVMVGDPVKYLQS
jgi:hypothetical protein